MGESSFNNYYSNYPNIKNVRIGNSRTIIDRQAFYSCSSLTTVTIGNGVTSIGYEAFRDCSSLTTVIIGNSVSQIGKSVFWSCLSLTTIIFKSTNQLTFDKYVFWHCEKLSTIYFYSLIEPKYSTESTCWHTGYCGSIDNPVSCAPVYCNTPLTTVYVPKDYNSTATTFCGKSVTFKHEL